MGGVRESLPGPPALLEAAVDTERHVARLGWDQAPRLFALVSTRTLRAREPQLASDLTDAADEGLTSVEQTGLRKTPDIESLLARIAWPPDVDGCALALERLVVPPDAERDLPEDPTAAMEALAVHPQRKDVRLLVAVLRESTEHGGQVSLLRQRDHDTDDAVAIGEQIAPGLVHALRATFS